MRNLYFPELPTDKTYTQLLKVLEEHFKPVSSYFYQRFNFWSAKKTPQETVAQGAARVKSLASSCGFRNELEVQLRDLFVLGMHNQDIRDKLFELDPTNPTNNFLKCFKLAQCKEAAMLEQAAPQSDMGNSRMVGRESKEGVYYQRQQRGGFSSKNRGNHQNFRKPSVQGANSPGVTEKTAAKCTVCGRKNHPSSAC